MIISTQIFYDHFLTGMNQNLQAELTDNDQISSGKRIGAPSDDPSGLWKVVDYQTQLSGIAQSQQAMDSAKVPVQSLDSSLSDLQNTLNSANTLAINGADASNDANSRLMIMDQVQTLFDSAVSTANTQENGQYIFAGYQSNVNPIDPTTGEFISDSNSVNVGIASGINVTTNVSAGSLFSFKRVNTTDSANGILPVYNWTNNGTNTIPDADPSSALETAAPAAGNFTASDAILTQNGGSLNVTVGSSTDTSGGAFVINDNNDTIKTDTGTFTITNGVYTGSGLAAALSASGAGITVAYDPTSKFTITSSGAAPATQVDFNDPATTMGNILGFKANQDTIGTGISSDNAGILGDVNLAAGSTLQDARDAINAASAGVKAQVVNVGTSGKPDFRLVIASDTAGNSANIDISVVSTTDTSGTGVNMLSYDKTTGNNMTLGTNITNYNYITPSTANDSIVVDNGTTGDFVIDSNHNTINFTDPTAGSGVGATYTATIPAGTYTGALLATAIQTAMNKALTTAAAPNNTDSTGAAFAPGTLTVSYNNNKFTIANTNANDNMSITWTGAGGGTVIPGELGFAGPTSVLTPSGGPTPSASSTVEVTGTPGSDNGIANNQIVVQEHGYAAQTLTIARGTYTPTQLASAIQTALANLAASDASGNVYSVTYDPNAMKFNIAQTNAGGVAVNFQWGNSNSTATQLLGFNPATVTNESIAHTGGSVQSDNPVLDNYYSFNNNYLNDNNILRALNFEKESLKNNDAGRVEQSLTYLNDLMDATSQVQAKIGATENEITAEGTYQSYVQTNLQTFMSDVQDTDVAKVSADLAQRQTTLQALRTISATVLNQSLFDFIKF